MTVGEHSISPLTINMAKRQKTDQAVGDDSDKNEPLPPDPSVVAKALTLVVNRRPDINEYRCEIGGDIDDFPTISTPLSDSELSPLPLNEKKKKKKKSKHEKTGAARSDDDDKTENMNTDAGATSETCSQSSTSQESAMDDT